VQHVLALVDEAMRSGEVVVRPDRRFDGVKVLTQLASPREAVAAWIVAHPGLDIVEIIVLRCDACITFLLAYRGASS
jgi:hypothetical protein